MTADEPQTWPCQTPGCTVRLPAEQLLFRRISPHDARYYCPMHWDAMWERSGTFLIAGQRLAVARARERVAALGVPNDGA